MPFWKAKPPQHQTLVGTHLLEDVVSSLPLAPVLYAEKQAMESAISPLFEGKPQGDAVLIIGNTAFYAKTISTLPTTSAPIIHVQTSFLDATCLLPCGVPLPHLSIFDTHFYQDEEEIQKGLVHLLNLGISCDKGLFDLVYSSFTLEKLLLRATPMLLDMQQEEQQGSRIRAFLTFGYTMGDALFTLSQGDLTFEEALACGMLYEARLGVRAGRVPLKLYQDLEGAITYHGLPSSYEMEQEKLENYFRNHTTDTTITLHLPKKKGVLAPYTLPLVNLLTS